MRDAASTFIAVSTFVIVVLATAAFGCASDQALSPEDAGLQEDDGPGGEDAATDTSPPARDQGLPSDTGAGEDQGDTEPDSGPGGLDAGDQDLAPMDTGGSSLHDAGPGDAGQPDSGCRPGAQPFLTVDRIPQTMNGSRPFTNMQGELEPYHLLLPTWGFTLDVIGPGDLELLEFGCGGRDWAGLATPTDDGWTFYVPEDQAMDEPGMVTCHAKVAAPCREEPLDLALEVEVEPMPPELDPFSEPDTWLLLTDRDHWTLEMARSDAGGLALTGTREPNGRSDLEDAMRLVGLFSDDTAPGAREVEERGVTSVSRVYLRRLMRSYLRHLREIFLQEPDGTWTRDSVHIHFVLQGDPDAPDPMDFDPEGNFSMIGIGGGDPEDRNVGRALIDWNNQRQEDDYTDPGLGIFTTTLISLFLDNDMAELVLAPFCPTLGGTPLGEHPGDPEIFSPGFDESQADGEQAQRAALLGVAEDLLGLGLAALTAHEIGHSIGLVPYGPPPGGLFAGELQGEFNAGPATDAHINTEGFNIMQQGFTLSGAGLELLAAVPRFNELNLAYLQRRLIVDPSRPREPPIQDEAR